MCAGFINREHGDFSTLMRFISLLNSLFHFCNQNMCELFSGGLENWVVNGSSFVVFEVVRLDTNQSSELPNFLFPSCGDPQPFGDLCSQRCEGQNLRWNLKYVDQRYGLSWTHTPSCPGHPPYYLQKSTISFLGEGAFQTGNSLNQNFVSVFLGRGFFHFLEKIFHWGLPFVEDHWVCLNWKNFFWQDLYVGWGSQTRKGISPCSAESPFFR